MDITRRNFVEMGAAAALTVGAINVIGEGASEAKASGVPIDTRTMTEKWHVDYEPKGLNMPWGGPGSANGDWNGTPEDLKAIGGCTMPLDELNHRRQLYVDSQTEYVKEDGTVVPEIIVKVRALANTYCFGTGNEPEDNSYDFYMEIFDEDEAQAYLDMPWGEAFTPNQYAAKSGRSLEECQEICEKFSVEKAMISRFENPDGTFYMQIPMVQGFYELHDVDIYTGAIQSSQLDMAGWDWAFADCYTGAPFFGSWPCTPEVVKDEQGIDPLDDVRQIWSEKTCFSLSPCTCRMSYAKDGILPEYPDGDWLYSGVTDEVCGHDIMTCLSCGEEAQFWIAHGIGREITYEEALARLDLSVEQGLMLQGIKTKNAETICQCSGDCCGVMGMYQAVGCDVPSMQNYSHYILMFDEDDCIQCGSCAARCPMSTITMDPDTGYPVVGDMCMTCGQCAYICPVGARYLVHKPEGETTEYWDNIRTMNNVIAAQRFENGYVW